MATDSLISLVILCAGFIAGYYLHWWQSTRLRSTGTIFVTKKDDKTTFSLELDEPPEEIEKKKNVLFLVDAPRPNSRRK